MRALLWQYTIFNHWSLAFEFALSRICVSIYCNWESNKCSAKWCLITRSIYHSQLECWNWIIFVIRFQFDLSSASRSFRVTYTLALPIHFGRSFLGTPKNGCNNEIFETNKIFRLHKSKVETISARIFSLPFTMAFGIFPHPMRCVSCITVGAHNNTLDWLPKQQSFLACTPYKVFGRGQVHNSGGATSHMQRSQPWLKQLLNEIFAIRMIFFGAIYTKSLLDMQFLATRTVGIDGEERTTVSLVSILLSPVTFQLLLSSNGAAAFANSAHQFHILYYVMRCIVTFPSCVFICGALLLSLCWRIGRGCVQLFRKRWKNFFAFRIFSFWIAIPT